MAMMKNSGSSKKKPKPTVMQKKMPLKKVSTSRPLKSSGKKTGSVTSSRSYVISNGTKLPARVTKYSIPKRGKKTITEVYKPLLLRKSK